MEDEIMQLLSTSTLCAIRADLEGYLTDLVRDYTHNLEPITHIGLVIQSITSVIMER